MIYHVTYITHELTLHLPPSIFPLLLSHSSHSPSFYPVPSSTLPSNCIYILCYDLIIFLEQSILIWLYPPEFIIVFLHRLYYSTPITAWVRPPTQPNSHKKHSISNRNTKQKYFYHHSEMQILVLTRLLSFQSVRIDFTIHSAPSPTQRRNSEERTKSTITIRPRSVRISRTMDAANMEIDANFCTYMRPPSLTTDLTLTSSPLHPPPPIHFHNALRKLMRKSIRRSWAS